MRAYKVSSCLVCPELEWRDGKEKPRCRLTNRDVAQLTSKVDSECPLPAWPSWLGKFKAEHITSGLHEHNRRMKDVLVKIILSGCDCRFSDEIKNILNESRWD